jgi:hypothetical protein
MLPPRLDTRTSDQILKECEALAAVYTPDWTGATNTTDPDAGRNLIELYVRLHELLTERLNKVPEKHFLSFLDMVGVEQFSGRPAEAPVTFLLSKKATTGGFIPAGSQVATTQTEKADAEVFETRTGFFATPATLQKIVNLVPGTDRFSEIPVPVLPPSDPKSINDPANAKTSLSSTASLSDIEHVLFIGSATLFGRKEPIDLTLELTISGAPTLFSAANLQWKRFDGATKSWVALTTQPTYTVAAADRVQVLFSGFTATEKSPVDGVEDFWLACDFIGNFSPSLQVPSILAIKATIAAPAGVTPSVKPDLAFFNAAELDTSKPFYPFGRRPAYADAFYVASKAAFDPGVQSATLKFKIRPYSDTVLQAIFANLNTMTSFTISTTVEWQYLAADGAWNTLTGLTFSYSLQASKAGAAVTILRTPSPNSQEAADGTFYGVSASWPDLSVVIEIPTNIGLGEVNGEKNYWIRALLKTDNPYGGDGFLVMQNGVPVVVGPTFIPPTVEKFDISYQARPDPVSVSHIRTHNNFTAANHVPGSSGSVAPFQPFVPITEQPASGAQKVFAPEPALYLGFDQAFGQGYISMFVNLADRAPTAKFPVEGGNPQIVWEYLNSLFDWKSLDVDDGTADLTTSGVVGFPAPDDSGSLALFSAPAYFWFRGRLASGTYDNPPQILGVYLNSVMAANKTTHGVPLTTDVRESLVGSANGEPHQTLDLIPGPILSGELWVREPEIPSPPELKQLLDEFQESEDEDLPSDAIEQDLYEVRAPAVTGGEPQIWVRWRKVPNFLSSAPRSRHFTLDRVNSRLSFGDSFAGLIPPVGKDNLAMRNLQSGGGETANQAATALAIKELKTSFPFIDKVFNVRQAEGGADPWSLEETLEFGPQFIKNRGRAVTAEDYEWMVRQEFSQVARVRCLPTKEPGPGGALTFKPGAVTLIVVPKSRDPLPEPSQGLLKSIREFIAQKTLGNIVTDIHAIGPNFEVIRVEAVIVPKKPEEGSVVVRRVARGIEDFLHPLTGGENGKGWEFGRSVVLSEIFAVIERTEGVDHVESARFPSAPAATSISVGENSLAASGAHSIRIL